jgi:hypothetical protein
VIGGFVQQGDQLAIVDEDSGDALAIPPRALVAAFDRYGRPLAAAPPPPSPEALEIVLEDGARGRLRAFRFRGWGDVEPSDYLLLERDGMEPVAGPAPLLVAALRHLARAARPT